jgi:hypothetical protein
MNISSLSNYFNNNVQSLLSTSLQGTGLTTSTGATSVTGLNGQQSDSTQLSPFAQLLSTFQQLQQSNSTKYQQVTQQIAANLHNAAQTAQSNGNTTGANLLNQLASDFTSASKTGQIPSVKDLAAAIGGSQHHHHSHAAFSDSDSDSSNSTSSTNQSLNQLLAAFQSTTTSASRSQSQNPLSIILNTLSTAGVTGGNS